MTFLVERLAEVRRHVDHLREIRTRVTSPQQLQADLTLHNDVMFSLLTVCQAVIDSSGELAGRRGVRFQDYNGAIRALAEVPGVPHGLVNQLLPLAGFRNVLVPEYHEYVELDYNRVITAMDALEPVDAFIKVVAAIDASAPNRDRS